MMGALLIIFAGSLAVYVLRRVLSYTARRPSLPPGPSRKPIIGNLFDLPPTGVLEWKHWAKHHELYGPISSLSIFGQHIIILNSYQYAVDLFEKKSSIYSDRPSSVFGGEMCGWRNSLAMSSYGERFRKIRKDMHQVIGTHAALTKFHHMQETETRRFLLSVYKTPHDLEKHIRRTTGAIILSISHGYEIDHESTDPFVKLADETLVEASMAFQPGSWLVDVIPSLRWLPDWFPGTGFKRVAQGFLAHTIELVEKPHAFVKHQMSKGAAKPSYTSKMLEDPVTPEQEDIIKWASAAIYGGGADTTVSTTYSFVLAMVLHPDVQRQAQLEIDTVVGRERLPTFDDRANLPYINALVQEALRWNPVLPMGIPHVSVEDDITHGYFIPKGAIVMPNIYQFTRDPSVYHEPTEFRPERFMAVDGHIPEQDPRDIVFGYGRRICPGKDLADETLYLYFAMVLAVFRISRAKDDLGKEVEVKNEWTSGLISRPKDFQCSILPRTDKSLALICGIEDEEFPRSDAETLASLNWKQYRLG